MAEALSSAKGTARKNRKDIPSSSRSFLSYGSTPLSNTNKDRLSLMSNARLQKITSNSLERLSFISEKDDNSDLESYQLEYSKYLLRKAQASILQKNKQEKEENVKKCFVSLKCELQDLLQKYVELSKEIGYLKVFFEILKETSEKVEDGKKILKMLKDNEFESLMKSILNSLNNTVNQLQLIDIDKKLIDEMFSNNIWGSESEIYEILQKIDSYIRNKEEISKIAGEIVEIKALSTENEVLRERFHSLFQKVSNEILETNYKLFTDVVKRAFEHREECKDKCLSLNLECDTDFLITGSKPQNTQLSFQLSKFEGSYPMMPNSSSTPQQN